MAQDPKRIRIIVDAMGGDFAPRNVVEGTVDALRETGGRFSAVLVGREHEVKSELDRYGGSSGDAISVIHASEVVEMHDPPNSALKAKKDSSISVALALHRDGGGDAFVSAGNTGAVMSASTLILGRIAGVGRPTIGALIPASNGFCFLVDAGANVDCRPRNLFEFGIMGSIYVSLMLDKSNPSVGLLSIGEEDIKGNEATLEAFQLFKKSSLNFSGNVEGKDILKGKVDVVVCDGFVGNVILKFGESIPGFFKSRFIAFASKSITNKIRVLLARGGLKSVMKELDYQEYGGVPLLGVNGVTIIGHGGSTPKAIKNMIFRAEEYVRRGVNSGIQRALEKYG